MVRSVTPTSTELQSRGEHEISPGCFGLSFCVAPASCRWHGFNSGRIQEQLRSSFVELLRLAFEINLQPNTRCTSFFDLNTIPPRHLECRCNCRKESKQQSKCMSTSGLGLTLSLEPFSDAQGDPCHKKGRIEFRGISERRSLVLSPCTQA